MPASQPTHYLALTLAICIWQAPAARAADPYDQNFYMSVRRGSSLPGFPDRAHATDGPAAPVTRGFRFSVHSTTDAAPVSEVTLSGFLETNFAFDTLHDLGDSASAGNVIVTPADGDARPHLRVHARRARIRIRSRTDTAVGQIRTLVSGDFFAGGSLPEGDTGPFDELIANSNPFRLRQAWGEWDLTPDTTLRFGQARSVFFARGFGVPRVDTSSPAGAHSIRQAQIRLTKRRGRWTFMASLENPETDLRAADGTRLASSRAAPGSDPAPGANDVAPDAIVAVERKLGQSSVRLAAVARLLAIDPDISGSIATAHDTAFGWGAHANAKLALGWGVTGFLGGIFGRGIGRYLRDNSFGAGVLSADGRRIKTLPAVGFSAGATIRMSKTVTAGMVYGYFLNDGTPKTDAISQRLQSGHVNVFWKPVPKLRFGLEGNWRSRRLRAAAVSGADSDRRDDAFRVSLGAWFFF